MLKKKIKNFVIKKTKEKFSNDDDLIRKEIIDSFGLIEIVQFIEVSLKLKCPIEKISVTNFNTINNIVIFLRKFNKEIK